ncbi:hypothetical protein [Piscinibacter gummiphilus]|uniref:DUF4234 domain-containing protein n=1 Tax=Piscinibacter gummiphilus TaxID=946333 RepID=A0ABZ0D2H0_9BURK|nr:hypothetical protein [Piscinibacter gummiphilus]WOB09525.1 hypothetical protein RXV79_05550 [Piscinibacter gummiphilus]
MKTTLADTILNATSFVVSQLSFEWLLTRAKRSNGGAIVFLRALLTSFVLYVLAVLLRYAVGGYQSPNLLEAFAEKLPWFGALFGAIYLALYSRFASQWTYVANVYNQIKSAEARATSTEHQLAIDQWKAGFIEDAQELHLATKGIFAGVIKVWLQIENVRSNFVAHAPGGTARLNELEERVRVACAMQARAYERKNGGA